MRTLPASFTTPTTTLCWAITLTRTDGLTLGTTDHDRDLTISGTLHRANAALQLSERDTNDGLPTDQTALSGVLTDDAITETDIIAGRWDGAGVTLSRVNWMQPADNIAIWSGTLGTITRRGASFQAEALGLEAKLETTTGRVFSRLCDARLGDARCGLDLTPTSRSAAIAITAATTSGLLNVSTTGLDPNSLPHGTVEITSGPSVGIKATIRSASMVSAVLQIQLETAFPLAISPGTTAKVTVGCDRRFATCTARFNNASAFRGFPHMPGDDAVIAGPASSGALDGGRRP
jgi:uncharacterized phage protein (TIGR02218 family)